METAALVDYGHGEGRVCLSHAEHAKRLQGTTIVYDNGTRAAGPPVRKRVPPRLSYADYRALRDGTLDAADQVPPPASVRSDDDPMFYILDDAGQPMPAPDGFDLDTWLDNTFDERIIASNTVGEFGILTHFASADQRTEDMGGPPLLWVTTVSGASRPSAHTAQSCP
jgi:hypothetical protein